jgi:RNA polymerase sigma factor (sigma-70 family)
METHDVPKSHATEDSLFRALISRAYGMTRFFKVFGPDGEDLSQESLTLMVPIVRENPALLQDEDAAAMMLLGIMRNRRADHVRHMAVEQKYEADVSREMEENWSRVGNPAFDLALSRLRGELFAALGQLKAEWEQLMVMYWIQGMEIPEIADIVEKPPDEISRILYRAKNKLKKNAELRAFFDEWEPDL